MSDETSPAPSAKPSAGTRENLLLDLSGDKGAALDWAARHRHGAAFHLLDKAELKWQSRREALARIRAFHPHTFAFFASDLRVQSARHSMMWFAALCGARRIVFADTNGREIRRTRVGVLTVESARLVLELLAGYVILVPLSWLLTLLLGVALVFRPVVRASRPRRRDAKHAAKTMLYVRATLVPAVRGMAAAGGMASHIAGFGRGALMLGHRLRFIASGDIGFAGEADVEVIEPSTLISATRALFELWNNLRFTLRALRVTGDRQGDVDFIYQRYSRFNWTGVALSLATGLPLMLEFNGSEVWVARHWDPVGMVGLLTRFERLNLRAADFIFVVSDVQRRGLFAAGVDAARIVVNPNGVDVESFHPGGGGVVRDELGIQGKVVVGFTGTFGPWHGAPVLARAATRINDSRCHFLFIGDGDERTATESIIETAGKPGRATFTGRVAHQRVAAYLDACDILVSPHVAAADGSEFFGSPTKLFEYMAMARPVVASRLGQIADVIVDGVNGLLVEPGDAATLAQAIERLAKDEALRRRLGAAARQTVIEHYTWRHNAARVFDTEIEKL
ncbi:MAG TPA: glycosyltransferase family 4 protein [Blastocatellia bacterium]|nr:glycosyltransferase family 4 protein [Blastocatellia bacterium]